MDNTDPAVINHYDLLVLLGKSIQSSDYQRFVDKLHERPTVDDFDFATYYDYEDAGLLLRYDNDKQAFTGVTIWNKCLRYEQFKGSLPGGISFADKRTDVNERFGQPLRTGTARGLNFPPEPKGYSDREAAYDKWESELKRQPVSELEWAVYEHEAYRLRVDFDMSENGTIRQIRIERKIDPSTFEE